MKKIIFTVLLMQLTFIGFTQTVFSEIFKPGPSIGQDAVLFKLDNGCIPNDGTYPITPELLNFGNSSDLTYFDWTFNAYGCPGGTGRSVIKFIELNNIPINAIIIDAQLVLFGVNDADYIGGNNHYPGSPYPFTNEGQLHRINSGLANNWDEQAITWNSALNLNLAPNFITIPFSATMWNWNYTISGSNLINMIQSMLGANNNNGFLLKLQQEAHYRSIIFASSDHPDSKLWPELRIKYMLPCDATFRYSVNTNNPYEYNFSANTSNQTNYEWIVDGNYAGSGQNFNFIFPGPGNYKICLFAAGEEEKCETCYELCIAENDILQHRLPESKNNLENEYKTYNKPLSGDKSLNEDPSKIRIQPNPTKNSWTISLNAIEKGQLQIKLFDISGRLLEKQEKTIEPGFNTIEQEGGNLLKGTYILEIKGKQLNIQEKLIKQ